MVDLLLGVAVGALAGGAIAALLVSVLQLIMRGR